MAKFLIIYYWLIFVQLVNYGLPTSTSTLTKLTLNHPFQIMKRTYDHIFSTTSNVTGRHWGPKRKLRAGYRAPSWHPHSMCCQSYLCLSDILGLCNACYIFIVKCGIACFLCTMCMLCVYSMFGHHRHPLDYLCVGLGRWRCPPQSVSMGFDGNKFSFRFHLVFLTVIGGRCSLSASNHGPN